ncbi:MAG: GMC family oxidoreductase, partial [Alphaproteobacteria bacterium]|nr:GMC family oxidoreductase [Alphaproteobacteria bacterium]
MTHQDDNVAAVTFGHDEAVVVIVGSGAGGGTLANELAQKGIDVVLLEAGPRIEMTEFVNDEQIMAERLTWTDRRQARGNRANMTTFPDTPAWMCKTVGGTSVHWAGTSVRLKDSEFKARTTYGDIPGTTLMDWPLSYPELAPYYARAEDKLGVAGTNGRPRLPEGNNYKVLALGARRIGYTAVH